MYQKEHREEKQKTLKHRELMGRQKQDYSTLTTYDFTHCTSWFSFAIAGDLDGLYHIEESPEILLVTGMSSDQSVRFYQPAGRETGKEFSKGA